MYMPVGTSLYVSEHMCIGVIMYVYVLIYIRGMLVYLHVNNRMYVVCVCLRKLRRAEWLDQISRGETLTLNKPKSDSLVVPSVPHSHPPPISLG